MRKFIISDIHGNGDIYDTIISYLDNIGCSEEVHLYINGDLIDRGFDSFRVLMDVVERIKGKGNVIIHYLGGNHELMMYDALRMRKPGKSIDCWSDWLSNGGCFIEGELDTREDGEELCEFFKEFMGELKICHLFDEKVKDKNLLLVHAQAPKDLLTGKELKIKDNNFDVFNAVWTRKENREPLFFGIGRVIGFNRIGLDGYFTIKGHTPVKPLEGFEIDDEENYINIDGGCAGYAIGMFEYDRVPLIEIKDNYFEIVVFNHDNEIIDGYYYDGDLSKMIDNELKSRKKFINPIYNGQAESYKKMIKSIFE